MHNTITFFIQKDHINSFLKGNSVLLYGSNSTVSVLVSFTYNVKDIEIIGEIYDTTVFIKLVQHKHFSTGPS